MVPMNALLCSLLGFHPPAVNSSPDDRTAVIESSRRSGRSPILTQDDVAGQYAWTAVANIEATTSSFKSHGLHNPPRDT